MVYTQFFIMLLMINTLPQVFFPIIEPLFLNLMNDFSNLDCMIELSLFKDFLEGVII